MEVKDGTTRVYPAYKTNETMKRKRIQDRCEAMTQIHEMRESAVASKHKVKLNGMTTGQPQSMDEDTFRMVRSFSTVRTR